MKFFRRLAHVVSILAPLMLFALAASAQPRPNATGADRKATADPRGTLEQPLIVKPSPKTDEEAAKEKKQEDDRAADREFSRKLAWFTGFVALLQAGLLGYQIYVVSNQNKIFTQQTGIMTEQKTASADAAKAAAESVIAANSTLATNRQIERAYISISHYRPGLTFGFSGSSTDDPVSKQDMSVRLKVTNAGNTPARLIRRLVQHYVCIDKLPYVAPNDLPFYEETLGETIDAFLVKGDHVNLPNPMKIADSDIRTIKSMRNNFSDTTDHPVRLFIIGYVDYVDTFGQHHRAGYARMYNPWRDVRGIQPDDPTITTPHEIEERHRRRNNLVFLEQAGYNYDVEIDDHGNPKQGQNAPR